MQIKKLLGVRETIFKNSAQGPAAHTVNSAYLINVPSNKTVPANKENSNLKWFSKINKKWHPYVKEMLERAGFGL